ncbi:MAG: winged helix-turn-helix transcriptional regulator [Thermoplasmatales archaeon]|nr:winged helix-turn-helix transcriptional regulator [Thermoplasmatales archaeon]
MNCGGKAVEIDELDYKLLNELAVNARFPLIELVDKLGCSSKTVNYRVNNLIKQKVIRAFRDLQHYSVGINFHI